jgi:hypothetical protein
MREAFRKPRVSRRPIRRWCGSTMPQITSSESPSSDADRPNSISYGLDEAVTYRNATSFQG